MARGGAIAAREGLIALGTAGAGQWAIESAALYRAGRASIWTSYAARGTTGILTAYDIGSAGMNAYQGTRRVVDGDYWGFAQLGGSLMGIAGARNGDRAFERLSNFDRSVAKVATWTGKETKGQLAGVRLVNPANASQHVRIDIARNKLFSRRTFEGVDHIHVHNGGSIGRNGQMLKTHNQQKSILDSHIPLSEYRGWSNWNRPQ